MDKLDATAWVGRQTVEVGQLSETHAAHIHATVGGQSACPTRSDPLPPLWHWCAFPNAAKQADLKTDGHVLSGDLLPPINLPRRMWAGGALTFHRSVPAGDPMQRLSCVKEVKEKDGKSGPMVFVTVAHEIHGSKGLAIEERQDLVYLQTPSCFTQPQKTAMPASTLHSIETQETLLFRYSAITFNAHRIHYDLPYAQEVEKYPGLVVHGPLQATWLIAAATRIAGRPPRTFEFRSVHPMFAGPSCDIALQEAQDGLSLWTGQDGHQCMRAHAVWEDTK